MAANTYSIRVDFSDGTFEIFNINATSIEEAFALLGTVEGMTGSMLVGTRSHDKQEFLAW